MLLNSSLHSSKVVRLAILAIVSGFLTLAPAVSAGQSSSIITFDGPGAGTGSGQGTSATGMNSKGTIVGTVTTSSRKTYGFLRQTNGKITKVEYPGAQYTSVYGINDSGTIVGSFSGRHDQVFLRTADGKFTSFVRPTPSFWKVSHSSTTSEVPVPLSPPTIFSSATYARPTAESPSSLGPSGLTARLVASSTGRSRATTALSAAMRDSSVLLTELLPCS